MLITLLVSSVAVDPAAPLQVSGIYPHLAVSNHAPECGIGVVAPWADRLWFLTYPPHEPEGGEDKLYSLDDGLVRYTHPASVGGTHANRMIHEESQQLIMGPYFIDKGGNVRAIPPSEMPARITATMRHLTRPEQMVYMLGMEKELYEVDVQTLEVTRLYGLDGIPVPGTHAKGGAVSQGRLVFSNNGDRDWATQPESGALAEWDGAHWSVVERTPFTEVTGPDGLLGGRSGDEPLWALGWDKRSVILRLRQDGAWYTFRLPKGSYTHDAMHGWYTEWPRIREVTDGQWLAHMHGLFYRFPPGFGVGWTGGIEPLSTYLKMPVDYCAWNGRIAMGCNDASCFDNPFVNQPSSNLWFGTIDDIRRFGAPAGWGGVWVDDNVPAGQASDAFLIAGFGQCVLHLSHKGDAPVSLGIELDRSGDGRWSQFETVTLPAEGYAYRLLRAAVGAQWLRVVTQNTAQGLTAYLHLASLDSRPPSPLFDGLAPVDEECDVVCGIMRPRGGDLGSLQLLASQAGAHGGAEEVGYFEAQADLVLRPSRDADGRAYLEQTAALMEPDFELDSASVIMKDHRGQRRRLPRTHDRYDRPFALGWPRGIREVVTERSLMNIHGTFYELPRPSSGGLARIRPITTHGKQIMDFCSWRGLLVLSGTRAGAQPDGHVFSSADGRAGLWFGNVDDLWRLGNPRGEGGPWHETPVAAGVPSDPYLMANYDHKRLRLSHDAALPVVFRVEVDVLASDTWVTYAVIRVAPGETLEHVFPDGYAAHWVRLVSDTGCRATAWLVYE